MKRSLSPLKSRQIRALEPQVVRLTGDADVKKVMPKPAMSKDPGKVKKADMKGAFSEQAMKPSKLSPMGGAKKKERG